VAGAALSVIFVGDLNGNAGGGAASLPAGCTKPAGGFLVVASVTGYNDSIGHGAPGKAWPIIQVRKGSTVNIVVCNIDRQAHGFQITHYYDRSIETVEPGQVIRVSFVADQTGTFEIYCSIFCTIHIYMQNGQLVVNT
jgi:nitrous oxide reductase